MPWYKKTEQLSLLALVLAALCVWMLPSYATYVHFIGRAYVSLLKMMVLPLILLSVILAFTKAESVKQLKQLSLGTLGIYLITSSMALLVGLVLSSFFIFEANVNETHEAMRFEIDWIERLISTNIFNSLSSGEPIHVIVFAIFLGVALIKLKGPSVEALKLSIEGLNEAVTEIVRWIIWFTPLAIFSLIWNMGANLDTKVFSAVGSFFGVVLVGVLIHALISLPLLARLIGKFNAYSFIFKMKKPLLVALGSASSAATMPVSMQALKDDDVSEETSQFVVPLGATLNMDGSALYQGVIVMLFISLSGMAVSFPQQVTVFILVLLSSAGTSGIPGGGIVMMTMILDYLGIPNVEYYIGIYLLVDRFWDYPVTMVNVWGDLIAAKTLDRFLTKTTGRNT